MENRNRAPRSAKRTFVRLNRVIDIDVCVYELCGLIEKWRKKEDGELAVQIEVWFVGCQGSTSQINLQKYFCII